MRLNHTNIVCDLCLSLFNVIVLPLRMGLGIKIPSTSLMKESSHCTICGEAWFYLKVQGLRSIPVLIFISLSRSSQQRSGPYILPSSSNYSSTRKIKFNRYQSMTHQNTFIMKQIYLTRCARCICFNINPRWMFSDTSLICMIHQIWYLSYLKNSNNSHHCCELEMGPQK